MYIYITRTAHRYITICIFGLEKRNILVSLQNNVSRLILKTRAVYNIYYVSCRQWYSDDYIM